jgi:hypothetical protein
VSRQLAQLLINQRQEFVSGIGIASFNGRQDVRNVAYK